MKCKACGRFLHHMNRLGLCRKHRYLDPRRRKVATVRCAKWRKNNPVAASAADKRWKLAHPEQLKAQSKSWRKRNPDKAAACIRAFIVRRPNYHEQWREKNKKRYEELRAIWKKNNPDILRLYGHKRRAAQKNQLGSVSKMIVGVLLNKQSGLCAYCERELLNDYEIDHIVPISRGGLHDDSNLQLLHRTCNRRKFTKTMDEFRRKKAAA